LAAREILLAAAAALVVSIACPGAALACACCSNEGQRYVETVPLDDFATALLDEVRFAPAAHLYTGEADVESIEGLGAKSTEFQLAVTKSDKSWIFDFSAESGGGQLALPWPGRVTRFEVDPREPQQSAPGTGPVLYKEWRLTATPRGTGIFARVTGGGQTATLILQGRGNSCTDATQFHAWTLVLPGPERTVTFYGAVARP
jgi:hypothetical protein